MRVARVRRQQQQQQGEDNSELVISPSAAQLEEADMSLLYCGTEERCTFLELQAGAPLNQSSAVAAARIRAPTSAQHAVHACPVRCAGTSAPLG